MSDNQSEELQVEPEELSKEHQAYQRFNGSYHCLLESLEMLQRLSGNYLGDNIYKHIEGGFQQVHLQVRETYAAFAVFAEILDVFPQYKVKDGDREDLVHHLRNLKKLAHGLRLLKKDLRHAISANNGESDNTQADVSEIAAAGGTMMADDEGSPPNKKRETPDYMIKFVGLAAIKIDDFAMAAAAAAGIKLQELTMLTDGNDHVSVIQDPLVPPPDTLTDRTNLLIVYPQRTVDFKKGATG